MGDEEKTATPQTPAANKDWFLQSLVEMVNDTGSSLGITLLVGGFLVSGSLSNGKEYFNETGKEFSATTKSDKVADAVERWFSKIGTIYDSDKLKSSPAYIHLKDTRFFSAQGDPIPHGGGVWWRGRLSEVQGFSFGSLKKT